MAITYREIKRFIQPLYQRYRNIFRGPRDSSLENLEMNKILIDLKRLDSYIENVEDSTYENIRILIGQRDPQDISIHEEYNDGKYYVYGDIVFEYDGDSATPYYLQIDTVPTLLSKLSRLDFKLKKLEDRKASN